jgi:hypothetical protein
MRTSNVERGELRKLPYLKHIPEDGRIVPIQFFYDHAERQWHFWDISKGRLQDVQVFDVFHGTYLSRRPVSPDSDYRLPFEETVLRHFSTPRISGLLQKVSQDLINSLGYIEKYFILLSHARRFKDSNATGLLQIELEGIFGVHRSYFDLLNRVVSEVMQQYGTKKVSLPDSFRKVAQMEPESLVSKYGVPGPLVQFYQQKKRLFFACRKIRDSVFHHGHSLGTVFAFDDGFAVSVGEKPWTVLSEVVDLWPAEKLRANRLGSALVVFALLTEDVFKTMAWLGDALLASCREPPTPCFDENVYLRTTFARHLHLLEEYEREQWIVPERALPEITQGIRTSDSGTQGAPASVRVNEAP